MSYLINPARAQQGACRIIIFSISIVYCFFSLIIPRPLHASFIEATIGTAVVNDATAAYYNPAALTLVRNPQLIGLGTVATLHNHFSGEAQQAATGFTLTGSADTNTHYYLPSLYLSTPADKKIVIGLAILSNLFNRDTEDNSLLRYVQSSNDIQAIDFVPAIGFKVNECFAIGAGINFSHARFILRPLTGFPSLNIPDSQSRNDTSADSLGGDIGFLMRVAKPLLVGFNFRSAMTYAFSGKSTFEGPPRLVSNHYHFKFWTPARNVLSANYSLSSCLGFISTVQYIYWNRFNNINVHGIATQINTHPVIIANAQIPYHLHNSWVITLGSYYRITPEWTIRGAGSYIQSPSNPHFQISNGDSIVLGASMAYQINKNFVIDGSYAHAFMSKQNIHIIARNIITGTNQGNRDSVSLKLTVNV